MSELIAKPVIKNKFWVVEDSGNKIATIQAVDDGSFVFVHNERRERFPTIKNLSKQYNIVFDKANKKSNKAKDNQIYGFPTSSKPYNELYDITRRLPVYTKLAKSKSYHCAGYYIVNYDNHWVKEYCPKLITLNRYSFRGPYCTTEEAVKELRKYNG
jgi:hypothetical protein